MEVIPPKVLVGHNMHLTHSDKQQLMRLSSEDYGRVAELWDRYWVPAYAPARGRLFDLVELRRGENILDVGTGTGATAVVAARLVGKTGSVLAIDNSRGMLSVAESKARRLGLGNVRFVRADFTSLPPKEGYFDAAISSYGIPDLDAEAVLRHFFKALKHGGRLCFCLIAKNVKGPGVAIRRLTQMHRTDRPGSKLAERRRLEAIEQEVLKRSNALYSASLASIRKKVRLAGFGEVRAFTETFPVRFPSAKAYLDILLLSSFHDEFAEMTPRAQRAFLSEARDTLERFKGGGGHQWQVEVNFCFARRV
jgi:ubiquinone/menaquinone biosynthesis C-methylase UbiE